MSLKKIVIHNVFTIMWILVFAIDKVGELLGCDYFGHYEWQRIGWLILYYITQYIVWPCDILFIAKDGVIRIDVFWAFVLGSIVSLVTCIAADFLLRKLLWNKIGKKIEKQQG